MRRPGTAPRARGGGGLATAREGVALVEFALSLPLLLFLVLGLLELANYALQRHRISQVALQVADNAGRIGETSFGGPKRIAEEEITDALLGGIVEAGSLDMRANGRIILSSLETNTDEGQWLHWQRCLGTLTTPSSYGREGDGAHGRDFAGMGPASSRITADPARPVMFVEVRYQLRPIAVSGLVPLLPITEVAAMPVRVDRDLSAVIARGAPSSC